jgi:hypothetical protein
MYLILIVPFGDVLKPSPLGEEKIHDVPEGDEKDAPDCVGD